MNPALKSYIEDCSNEIPFENNIEFVFYLPNSKKDIKIQKSIKNGLINYFKTNKHFLLQEKIKLKNRVFDHFFKSVLFLVFAILFERFAKVFLTKILLEGLYIGGWVFLWEAFSVGFFEMRN